MNIITKKVRLIPASFVGTEFLIRVADDSDTFGIFSAQLAEDADSAVIDWGDGIVVSYAQINRVTHTYAQPGIYTIRVSDAIGSLRLAGTLFPAFRDVYPKMVEFVKINASQLQNVDPCCFMNCENLKHADFASSMFTTVNLSLFKGCSSLAGRVDFPSAREMRAYIDSLPFEGCLSVEEIHFRADAEYAITHSEAYGVDNTLGAKNAIVKFDL